MMLLTALDFGLPHRRKRIFVVGVNRERAGAELICDADAVLASVFDVYLPAMRLASPPVDPWSYKLTSGLISL